MDLAGAYTADRAAALSGVPKSTIHWWARNEILVPSVSAEKVKLWSYSDLMGLRVIYWLRQRKTTDLGVDIPRTSMPAVRQALDTLGDIGSPIWQPSSDPALFVDGAGQMKWTPIFGPGARVVNALQQPVKWSRADEETNQTRTGIQSEGSPGGAEGGGNGARVGEALWRTPVAGVPVEAAVARSGS